MSTQKIRNSRGEKEVRVFVSDEDEEHLHRYVYNLRWAGRQYDDRYALAGTIEEIRAKVIDDCSRVGYMTR